MLNEKGMASIEMIPILMMFVLLVNFGLGFFGVIHAGILNSIAARNYAFETFRNRANLNYLRDDAASDVIYYWNEGFRFHSIVGEDSKNANNWVATKRPIKFTDTNTEPESLANVNDHNNTIREKLKDTGAVSDVFDGRKKTDDKSGVSPVWLMTSYGICLRASCDAP
jgi:hypothetical protein